MKNNTFGTVIEYNENSDVTCIKTYRGNGNYTTIDLKYDDRNRISSYTMNSYEIQYEYDDCDRVTHMKEMKWLSDEKYSTIHEEYYEYNENNQLISDHIIDYEQYEEWNTYDNYHNKTYVKHIDEDGIVDEHYYMYDELNRVIYSKDIEYGSIHEYWYKYDDQGKRRVYKTTTTYINI